MKDFGHLGRPPGWGERLPGDDGGDNQHDRDDQRGCGDQHSGGDQRGCGDQYGGGSKLLPPWLRSSSRLSLCGFITGLHIKNCRSSREVIFSPCQQGVGDRLYERVGQKQGADVRLNIHHVRTEVDRGKCPCLLSW